MTGRRTLAIFAIATVFGAACGSPSTITDSATASPTAAVENETSPSEPEPSGSAEEFAIQVTASGSGGCVDLVEIQNLDQQGTTDGASVHFDLVYVHSCGDKENSVRYDEAPTVKPNTDGPSFTIRTPDCDDASCVAGTSFTLGLGDNPVPLIMETADTLTESKSEIVIPAFYDYSTTSLSDDPLDVTLTVRVFTATAPPAGGTTPIATAYRAVEVVFGGFIELEFPFAGVADSAIELESFGLSAPEGIDWATRAAVVFSIPTDLCPPVLSDLEIVDGVAQPVFVDPGYLGCEEPLLSHTVVAAVDRDFLARAHTLRLPSDPVFFEVDVDAEISVSPHGEGSAPTRAPSPTFESAEGPVPIPRKGEALPHRLKDGTPLIIVHHHDGTVSALDARALSATTEDDGQRLTLVRWNARTRNFMGGGIRDEFGRSTNGPRSSDLRGFATRIVDGDLEVGDPTDPPAGSPIAVSADPPAAADAQIASDAEPLSIEEALASPTGSVIFIDAQVVFVGSDARLCDDKNQPTFEAEPCSDGSPAVEDVGGDDGILTIWHAPILATRTAEGFSEVVPLGGYSSSAIND